MFSKRFITVFAFGSIRPSGGYPAKVLNGLKLSPLLFRISLACNPVQVVLVTPFHNKNAPPLLLQNPVRICHIMHMHNMTVYIAFNEMIKTGILCKTAGVRD